MEKGFGPLYTAFDINGKRKDYHSKELSKLEVVKLHQDLYSEYLKVYYELRNIRKKLEEMEKVSVKTSEKNRSLFEALQPELEELIDERVKDMLRFNDEFVQYGGEYASITYGGEQLGDSACIQHFKD